MEIEKLIKHMREEAQDYRSGRTLGRAFADCMDKNGSSSNAGTTDGYAGTTLSVLDCFYDITGDWNRVCNAHVTHWMPLPQPPKEASHD